MIDTVFWTWVPRMSLGPLRFGARIDEYLRLYPIYSDTDYCNLHRNEKYYSTIKSIQEIAQIDGITEYRIPEFDYSFTIYTRNNLIDSFRVETYLYYKGHDIVWASLEKAMEIIGRTTWDKTEPQMVLDDLQQIYYFDDLGLTLWTLDGKVVTAFCHAGGCACP